MHSMLNTLRRQLWLTLFVFPLEPAFIRDEQFDSWELERGLDTAQSGLYSYLKQSYFHFVSHLEHLAEAGKLQEERHVWANRLLALRGHILQEREAWTAHPSRGALGAWPAVNLANWLVSLRLSCSRTPSLALI